MEIIKSKILLIPTKELELSVAKELEIIEEENAEKIIDENTIGDDGSGSFKKN